MILRFIFSICLFISLNSVVLAALPTNDNFSKLNKINFVQNVEAAKEKFLSKDYQGVINLLSIKLKQNIQNFDNNKVWFNTEELKSVGLPSPVSKILKEMK